MRRCPRGSRFHSTGNLKMCGHGSMAGDQPEALGRAAGRLRGEGERGRGVDESLVPGRLSDLCGRHLPEAGKGAPGACPNGKHALLRSLGGRRLRRGTDNKPLREPSRGGKGLPRRQLSIGSRAGGRLASAGRRKARVHRRRRESGNAQVRHSPGMPRWPSMKNAVGKHKR